MNVEHLPSSLQTIPYLLFLSSSALRISKSPYGKMWRDLKDVPLHSRSGGLKTIYYRPLTQVILLGLVCFMGPGLFNALTGLGAAGQVDSATSANANATLYATFTISAFFSGPICNLLGPKVTLFLGSIGYTIYIAAFLIIKLHPNADSFVIASGAILGICAGLLWTAQGTLMLAYPTEGQKGRFIGIFWVIYNMGGIVGAAVSFATNFNSEANSVGKGTYVTFLILSFTGVLIPLLMIDPRKITRSDGTRLTIPQTRPDWKTEIKNLALTIKNDPLILMLLPMFWASNWFYTWQFNDFNGALFNIRTRSLNNLIYWLSQIVWSYFIGWLLDRDTVRRRARAFIGWGILFAMLWATYIWGYFYQREYTRESIPPEASKMDLNDGSYVGRALLYALCAILGATWQITVYWIIGTMSNDLNKLACFTGLYKSIQSAGAAVVWRADAIKVPYQNIFLSTWILSVVGLAFALPMINWRVVDQTDENTASKGNPRTANLSKVDSTLRD
ncbi:hypothetical protein NP233_g8098 [Leucocoprinus birnbaumii]|uniref:MFS general substrate transporter n=1 Tax=Leucocoprinus birnbaumii TaxID=56174 RepID=A0AAD5VMW9_9AGAR|nr:hypothetical protein NP233_g8098 [Leucocoprinus birnbaumii]